MNILCLNTAFDKAYIALKYNGKEFFKINDASSKHSENLLVEVEKLLENAVSENSSNTLKKIDVLAVVVGPGSFTGLRIAIATAKAILATSDKMKCVALNSLELIAFQSKKKDLTAILDGLSGFYFVSKFVGDKTVEAPKMITSDEIRNYKNFVSIESMPFETEKVTLSPEALLMLAEYKSAKGEFIPEAELLPLYLRKSQAEANLNDNKK